MKLSGNNLGALLYNELKKCYTDDNKPEGRIYTNFKLQNSD